MFYYIEHPWHVPRLSLSCRVIGDLLSKHALNKCAHIKLAKVFFRALGNDGANSSAHLNSHFQHRNEMAKHSVHLEKIVIKMCLKIVKTINGFERSKMCYVKYASTSPKLGNIFFKSIYIVDLSWDAQFIVFM